MTWGHFIAPWSAALGQTLEAGAIIVTVTDRTTGKPIDNAQVFILGGDSPQNSLTNVKGAVVFENMQPGAYRVHVEANGYDQTTTAIEVEQAQRVKVSVALASLAPLKTIASVISKASVVNVSVEELNENSAQRKVSSSLSDALNKLAGVNIDNDLYGADSFNVSLRGANSSQTSYSLDGIRINGITAQALGGAQDLFSGASVDFAPSAGGPAGNVNFTTMQPSKLWSYNFFGAVGNYSKTLGSWSMTGGFGKLAMAIQRTGGGQYGPLEGALYRDQTGDAYVHEGGFVRTANLFRGAVTLSPVTTFKYSIISGISNSSAICATATALLPCSQGPGNNFRNEYSYQTLAAGSLIGHLQFNVNAFFGKSSSIDLEPRRAVNGIVSPYSSTGVYPSSNFGVQFSSTAGRHTLAGGFFHGSQFGSTTSTYNSAQTVQSIISQRYGTIYVNDKIKANDKLTITHSFSQSSATGASPGLEFYESAVWQPKVADSYEASIGVGSSGPSGTFSSPLGDPLTGDYDCYNHSVFVQGPTDQSSAQSSINYGLGWRHTIKNGFWNLQIYRNRFVGGSSRVAVPIAAEPAAVFPNGLSAYLTALQQTWSQPTVCGNIPFDPNGVYVSQNINGLAQVNQGLSFTAQIPIGKTLLLFPTYAVTNAYYSALDTRLLTPYSYYAIGTQLPRVPLHKAGLILHGAAPHSPLEWLADAEFTSAGNPQNQPAYTVFNAGVVLKLPLGSLSFLGANLFGTHTALFATYQGVNPMPLQGGGTFALSTTPLAPRTFTVQYQIHWRQHFSPPTPAPSPSPTKKP